MPESEYSRAQNYDGRGRFLRAVGAILALPSPDGVRVREGVSGRGFSSHWRRAEWGEERGGESMLAFPSIRFSLKLFMEYSAGSNGLSALSALDCNKPWS